MNVGKPRINLNVGHGLGFMDLYGLPEFTSWFAISGDHWVLTQIHCCRPWSVWIWTLWTMKAWIWWRWEDGRKNECPQGWNNKGRNSGVISESGKIDIRKDWRRQWSWIKKRWFNRQIPNARKTWWLARHQIFPHPKYHKLIILKPNEPCLPHLPSDSARNSCVS